MDSTKFLSRTTATQSGCVEWTGAVSSAGYGALRVNSKQHAAHRYSYEIHIGPIPTGLMVLHRCDNRACVRPEHLFVGTAKANMVDMASKGRAKGARPKLSAEAVMAIRGSPMGDKELADKWGVVRAHVRGIRAGRYWKHL